MGLLIFQIKQIPDLSLNKYQSLADTGIEGVLSRHSSFLRQWHGICTESGTSFHLLYLFLPNKEIGSRLKLYFIIQGDVRALENVKPLLKNSPLSDFYEFSEAKLPEVYFKAGATLVKNERVAEIYNPLTSSTKSVHYVPKWEMKEDARLYDLFRIMESIGLSYQPYHPCAYRIDLYPSSMVQETRERFTPILKDLQGDNDIKLIREDSGGNHDSYAQNICKEYEDWMSNVEVSPHFRVNIYGFADNIFLSKVILNAAGSEALSEGDFSLAPIKPDSNGYYSVISRMREEADSYCFYPKKAILPSWSTTYIIEEVEPFFRFPVLFDGENIELPKETAPVSFKNGVFLGKDTNGFPVRFPVEDLPRHAFFTGTPGSGKTNTMLHLVTELKKKEIPFLVLEPAKKEYRAILGNEIMRDVHLFSPHLQSHFPLRMNPFEFPAGVRLSEHINALLEVFEGSFVLEGPTFKFLSSSIQKSYTDLGWDIEDINGEVNLPYPNIQNIYDNLESEINTSSYDSELKGNVRAFLQVRLGGLMERDAGELFDTSISTLKPEQWLHSSAIVELEVLGEQAKNFFVLLVCHYILETLRVDPQGGVDPSTKKQVPVRHAIFIEEAHNIIAPSTQQSSSDSVDPKISATAYIVKMLAEVRALREAIVIADQLPTALASEVTKNTGLKLVHRLTAQDDREQIGTAISASTLQLEQVATFSKGKALIYYEQTQKPYEIQVEEWKKPDIDYNFANDLELYSNIAYRIVIHSSVMSALYSWREKYVFPVYDKISEMQEKFKSLDYEDSIAMISLKSESILLLNQCEKLKRKCERLYHLWCEKGDGGSYENMKNVYDAFEETRVYIQGLYEWAREMDLKLGGNE